ncbi:multidrug ABC transporter permease [Sphaerisporangium rufum]|uniref:Multidrug ABC transporter permease n=1 Tax=Sphaerisporangium rufum TaxID=1381558 RepID=A0A919UZR5_9ACTN|nr:ABC transporter ATP-binding protein [Sphaerisporangium rufum]GII75868.1 multidrug ABC transporter permease [Sphaerisporangium rufum]
MNVPSWLRPGLSRRAAFEVMLLAVRTSPRAVAELAVCTVLATAMPPLFVLAGGWVASDIAAGAPATAGLAVLVGAYFGGQILTPVRQTLAVVLARRVEQAVRSETLALVNRPAGIAHLHDERFVGSLRAAQVASSGYFTVGSAVRGLAEVCPGRLSAVVTAVILARYLWWAPIVLGGGWLVYRAAVRSQVRAAVAGRESGEHSEAVSRADYLRGLLLDSRRSAELILMPGARPWLVGRFEDRWSAVSAAKAGRDRRAAAQVWAGAVVVGAHLLVAWAAVDQARQGEFGVAALLVVLQAMAGMESLGWIGPEYLVEYGAPAAAEVRRLPAVLDRTPDVRSGPRPVPATFRAITVRRVEFGYRDTMVLHGVDLELRAGRSLAVVGLNGAGKSTLARLLTGALDPARGALEIDGVPLTEFDRRDWLSRCVVADQEVIRYPLSLAANVAPGEVSPDLDLIEKALREAGADALLDRLPDGLDTLLLPESAHGVDLSGGEWQRLVLARILYRLGSLGNRSSLVILDEPTASMDVRAEERFNQRFVELAASTTAVLISHRLSTVRHADEIVLLGQGRVIEQGTHDELMSGPTRYARMFARQAERFRAAKEDADD